MNNKLKIKKRMNAKRTVVYFSDLTNKSLNNLVNTFDKAIDIRSIGPQGYIVIVSSNPRQNTITIAGNNEIGWFYGLQSLKGLIKDNKLVECIIFDKPAILLRGAVFGDLRRWHEGALINGNYLDSNKRIPYRELFKKMKFNFAWLAGWNGCYERTVMAFNDQDVKELSKFLEDCKLIFVTPSVGLKPSKQTVIEERSKGGVIYSSKEDIEGVSKNLLTLLKIGFHSVHLAFDDIPEKDQLNYNEDVRQFGSIGKAHYYFIKRVYDNLRSSGIKFKLRIVPLVYHVETLNIGKNKEYLEEISKLPKDIDFVCDNDSGKIEDLLNFIKLGGDRSILIWSNFYPALYKRLDKMPESIRPFSGGDSKLFHITDGYFFLPIDIPYSKQAIISWYSAAEFMWNPERYNQTNFLERLEK